MLTEDKINQTMKDLTQAFVKAFPDGNGTAEDVIMLLCMFNAQTMSGFARAMTKDKDFQEEGIGFDVILKNLLGILCSALYG